MHPTDQYSDDDKEYCTVNIPLVKLSPLMDIPLELREIIYGFCLPKLMPPRWYRQKTTKGHPVAAEPRIADSYWDLLLCSRQISEEVSAHLYLHCQFVLDLAPIHASLLDANLLPGQDFPDKVYNSKIRKIILKANGEAIQNFPWNDWNWAAATACDRLHKFDNLQKLTLDWRVPNPNPCDVIQPTAQQWQSISPYFEKLHDERPKICIEVLASRRLHGSIPKEYRKICTSLEDYGRELSDAHTRILSPFLDLSTRELPIFLLCSNPLSKVKKLDALFRKTIRTKYGHLPQRVTKSPSTHVPRPSHISKSDPPFVKLYRSRTF